MAIEQIVSYLKENQGRYSAEQLREALLKAGYQAKEIDEAVRMAAEGGGIAKAETAPRQSVGAKILFWLGGFFFADFFIGATIGISFAFLRIFRFSGGLSTGIFGGYFNHFIIGGIAIIAEIFIFFRVRRRFVYFARGMLTAIILQIVAIVALIILASLVMTSLNVSREKSRDARRVADIRQIQLALELYFDATNYKAYPNELAELAPKFIPSVPRDPLSNQPYGYEKKPDGSYYLKAELEDAANPALRNDINPGNQFYEVSDSPQQIPQPPRPASNAKLPTVTEIPHNPNLKCTDTDGGDKPYSKGSVTGTGRCIVDGVTQDCGTVITETDVCFVNYGQPNFKPTVTEYFCGSDGRITGQSRVCANGCENGVCR